MLRTIFTEDYFNKPIYSDVIVRCRGKQWFCHKFILCPVSEFFRKQCLEDDEITLNKQDVIDIGERCSSENMEVLLRLLYKKGICDRGLSEVEYVQELVALSNVANALHMVEMASNARRYLLEPVTDCSTSHKALRKINEVRVDLKLGNANANIAGELDKLEEKHILQALHSPAWRHLIPHDTMDRYILQLVRDPNMCSLVPQVDIDRNILQMLRSRDTMVLVSEEAMDKFLGSIEFKIEAEVETVAEAVAEAAGEDVEDNDVAMSQE